VVQAGGGSSTRRFAGSRANQSDASIDGITLSNQYDGTQISPLVSQIESFEEIRVDMANNTAEFGAIGQVTIISKSGSNDFHGSAFDYYATPWFRARDTFAQQRGTGVRHNPALPSAGRSASLKFYNHVTAASFSFETTRGSQVLSNLTPSVPTALWRNGDFSREPPIRDPFNGNAPFAGNLLPASRVNPVSKKIQERFYPAPNFGDPNVFVARNYRTQLQRPFDPNTYWTTRMDHRFTERHFVFGRYTWNRSPAGLRQPVAHHRLHGRRAIRAPSRLPTPPPSGPTCSTKCAGAMPGTTIPATAHSWANGERARTHRVIAQPAG
jgi:hypothetical protein